jgi:putative hemolysin
MLTIALEILLLLLLVIANGVFALSEIAMISARRARLQHRAEQGDAGARVALELVREPTRFLSTVQIGISLVGILAGAFGGATLAEAIADRIEQIPALAPYGEAVGLAVVVVGVTYLSLVIGELAPKRLALRNPEQVAARVARPMRWLSRLASPAVRVLSWSTDVLFLLLRVRPAADLPVSAEEIKILVEQGATSGVFEATEQDIVESALFLGERRISANMTPRTEIVWVDLDAPLETIQRVILNSSHSYFPAGHSSLDNVSGVLRGRDLLARLVEGQPVEWGALLRPPLFVPEAQTLLDVLRLLKETGQPLVLIIEEYGGLQGILTPTDVLEALIGNIQLPGQEPEPETVQREDGSWLLDGRLPISKLKELLDMRELPEEDQAAYATLGGFVMKVLGQIPAIGQRFDFAARRFEIVDMDGHRVDRVLVSAVESSAAQSGPRPEP